MFHFARPPRSAAAPRMFAARLGLLGLLALPAAAGCAQGGQDDGTPNNQSFTHWCGATPCDWEVDEGDVRQVGTWHRHDYAVLFPAEGTVQISQRRETSFVGCLHFDVTAKVDHDATLTLA